MAVEGNENKYVYKITQTFSDGSARIIKVGVKDGIVYNVYRGYYRRKHARGPYYWHCYPMKGEYQIGNCEKVLISDRCVE